VWIIQELKNVALWNKRHFEEKNRECAACLKYSVLIFVEKIYIKCNISRVAVGPSYIWDARFLKVNEWVHVRHDKEQSRAYDSKSMHLRATGQAGNLVGKWATVSFSWWPRLLDVEWFVGQSLRTTAGRQGKGMDDKAATGQLLARASLSFLPTAPPAALPIKPGDTLSSRHVSSCDIKPCSWDVTGDLTLNSMVQIHTSVTLLTSRDLAWSSGRLTSQHASQISAVAHISWDVTYVSSVLQTLPVVCRNGGNAYWKSAPKDLFISV